MPDLARIKIKQFGICPDPTGTGVLLQNLGAGAPLGKAGIELTQGFSGLLGASVGPGAYGARLVSASGLSVSKNEWTGSTDSMTLDAGSDDSQFRRNVFDDDVVDDGQGNCWQHNSGAGAFPATCSRSEARGRRETRGSRPA